MTLPTRRRALFGLGATAAAAATLTTTAVAKPGSDQPARRRGRRTRLLHLSDAHVAPREGTDFSEQVYAHEGRLRRALARGMRHRPDAIVQGGDAVYAADNQAKSVVAAQWELHESIYREVRVPVHHVIGNHDCWYGPESEGDPLAWKGWARKVYGMGGTGYYAVMVGSWKLIVLDSIQRSGDSYVGWIDDAQLEWLARELEATARDTPVVVASHIPVLTTYSFVRAAAPAEGATEVAVDGSVLVLNCRKLVDLFTAHPQVRLVLGGHEHTYESITYNKVAYYTLGSTAGNWDFDKDPDGIGFLQTAIGYGVIDLYEDGSFEVEYLSTGPRDDDDFSADDLDRFPG